MKKIWSRKSRDTVPLIRKSLDQKFYWFTKLLALNASWDVLNFTTKSLVHWRKFGAALIMVNLPIRWSQWDVVYLGWPTAPSYMSDRLKWKRQNTGVAGYGCVQYSCAQCAWSPCNQTLTIYCNSAYLTYTAMKNPFMYSFSGNSATLALISTFMCLWAIYIIPGSVHIFPPAEKADPSWEYIIRSQTHECGNWDWDPRYFFSGNICFKFSAFCLCSVL